MRVETENRQVFDDSDPLCQCHVVASQGELFAFVQAIDTGMDGRDRHPVRYWGKYSHDTPEAHMLEILRTGGKWPRLPDLER